MAIAQRIVWIRMADGYSDPSLRTRPVTVHLQPPGAGDIGMELDQGFPLTVRITVRRGAELRTLRVIVGHSLATP
jgi:hypothetical protein